MSFMKKNMTFMKKNMTFMKKSIVRFLLSHMICQRL